MLNNTFTNVISDPDKDQTIIVHTERFDGLLDHNAELRATKEFGSSEFRHVANIPGILIENYCYQKGISWQEFFKEKQHIKNMCNDPDLAYFRVAPGKV